VPQAQQEDQLGLALAGHRRFGSHLRGTVAMMDLLPQKVVGKTMNSAGSVLFMTTFAIDQDAVTASIRMSSWCECRLVGALSSATAVSESPGGGR